MKMRRILETTLVVLLLATLKIQAGVLDGIEGVYSTEEVNKYGWLTRTWLQKLPYIFLRARRDVMGEYGSEVLTYELRSDGVKCEIRLDGIFTSEMPVAEQGQEIAIQRSRGHQAVKALLPPLVEKNVAGGDEVDNQGRVKFQNTLKTFPSSRVYIEISDDMSMMKSVVCEDMSPVKNSSDRVTWSYYNRYTRLPNFPNFILKIPGSEIIATKRDRENKGYQGYTYPRGNLTVGHLVKALSRDFDVGFIKLTDDQNEASLEERAYNEPLPTRASAEPEERASNPTSPRRGHSRDQRKKHKKYSDWSD